MILIAVQELMLSGTIRGLLLAGMATQIVAVANSQELPPVNEDIPWRRDVAAGELKDAGRSRLLPQEQTGDPAAHVGQRQIIPASQRQQTPVSQVAARCRE